MRTLLVCLLTWTAAAVAQVPVDPVPVDLVPVDQEPRHHLVFSGEALRILDVRIPAGDTSLDHEHMHDNIYVCIDGSPVKAKPPGGEWSTAGPACTPGRTGAGQYTGRASAHAVQNAGSELYHLVLVENQRPGGWTANPADAGPGRTLARENRAFQAYDVALTPDAVMHRHALPAVLILVSGELTAGGKRLDEPGQWMLFAGGEAHTVAGPPGTRAVEIEVR